MSNLNDFLILFITSWLYSWLNSLFLLFKCYLNFLSSLRVYAILVRTSSKSNVTSLKKFSNRHREIERPNVTTFIQNKKEKKKFYLLIPFRFSKILIQISSTLSNTFETFIQASSYHKKKKLYLFMYSIQKHTSLHNDTIFCNYETFKHQIVLNITARLYLTLVSRFAYNRIATHCSNFKKRNRFHNYPVLVHGPSHAKFTSRINEQEDFLPIVRSHILRRRGAGSTYHTMPKNIR